MSADTNTGVSTQVYEIYIQAEPKAIWDAITSPEWSVKYGYGGKVDYDLRPGGAYRAHPSEEMKQGGAAMGITVPDVVIDGEVIEADPPHKLVHTWRMLNPRTWAISGTV